MDSSDLAALFTRLQISQILEPTEIAYTAIDLEPGKNIFLAKISESSACLLIATSLADGWYPTPIQLENLSVQHGLEGTVLEHSFPHGQRFSRITLTKAEPNLLGAYLRFSIFLCEFLEALPSPRTVSESIRDFADMLQCLRKPNRSSIQGLWAELLVIVESSNPSRWLAAWHNDPLDLHDFCFEERRVEVKSTSGQLRNHSCSHRQLWPPIGKRLSIASVLVDGDASGESIFDLAEQIRRIAPEAGVRLDRIMLEVLGQDFTKAGEYRYDRASASASILFFPVESIPRLAAEVPDGISEISYNVMLHEHLGVVSIDAP